MEVENSQSVDITPNKDGGVLKEILKVGEGEEHPLSGDKVSVHYVGTLLADGSKFDSSRDRGQQFEFTLGKGEVIKAWDVGVATMKKGEICKLTCRSDYAYGPRGSPPKIPPDSTLVFEVELFSWRGEDLTSTKDGGIIRRILSLGDGYLNPNDGAMVTVSLIGRVNGTTFDERELNFPLGEGSEHNIPEGLERALERFKKNEKSVIKLMPNYAFGAEGHKDFGVPPNSDVEYEVHLKDFTKAKESWEMDQEEKLEQANLCKQRGTDYFKAEKFNHAIKYYKKVTDYLQYDSGLTDEQKKDSKTILLAGHLNLSMCYLKIKDYLNVLEQSTKVIEMDPDNVKAYFRRGQAHLSIEDADLAKMDFEKCVALDPSNKAALHQLQICTSKIKQQKQKEKKIYGGMFDKFAKVDAKKQEKKIYGGMFDKFAKVDDKKVASNHANSDVMSGDLGEWDETKGEKRPRSEAEQQAANDLENLNNVEMI